MERSDNGASVVLVLVSQPTKGDVGAECAVTVVVIVQGLMVGACDLSSSSSDAAAEASLEGMINCKVGHARCVCHQNARTRSLYSS